MFIIIEGLFVTPAYLNTVKDEEGGTTKMFNTQEEAQAYANENLQEDNFKVYEVEV
jgi:hypothetical protein